MRIKKNNIKNILVLGANSSIAKAICRELAKQGCNEFYFLVKDLNSIKLFTDELITKYNVKIFVKFLNLLEELNFESLGEFLNKDYDLCLIAAGYIGDTKKAEKDINESRKIIDTNFSSICHFLNYFITEERISKNGRLWVFSSVAGDKGRPSNYYYGAAKAGLQVFCEGLMLRCTSKPFFVRIIKAGYMYTPMTINKVPEILCVKPHNVAKILLKRPNKNGIEYLPWWWRFIMLLVKALPHKILSKL